MDANSVAGDARLGHLEEGVSDPISIADANLVVREALHREVFAELAKRKILTSKLFFPISIATDLIHEDGSMFTAVALQISLAITVDIQSPNHAGALNRDFPYRCVDGFAFPGNIAREADINRQQTRHESHLS